MDRKWMFASRLSKEYGDRVKEFCRFAVEHANDSSRIICPCLDYCHLRLVNVNDLDEHLVCNGIDKSYTCWTRHGEKKNKASQYNIRCSPTEPDTTYEWDHTYEIANMVQEDLRDCPEMFDRLVSDSEKPLYAGCAKFTRLSAVLKLYNLKAGNGWSDKSFTKLLALLKEMLPEDNVLPGRMYEAKKMLSSIGTSYEKIHACPNDCILFRNEYASLVKCPKCEELRYKKESSSPRKVVWYFPIVLRFRRMYGNAEDAKNLTWHAEGRVRDGKLRHPSNSP